MRHWSIIVRHAFCAGAVICGFSASAAAQPKPIDQGRTNGWGRKAPAVESAVQSGKPLVVEIFVPLCSDSKGGRCGKNKGAGDPTNLDDNLYWGAVWGARRYFERGWLGWKKIEQKGGSGSELERLVLSRQVSGPRWGTTGSVEQLVVLHAFHGDSGKEAFDRFREKAQSGGSVTFSGRTEEVSVVGFMGRNPLLKNGKVPLESELPKASNSGSAIPSFSIAAHSRETFGAWLAQSGSPILIAPRGPVASEAYVLHEVLKAIGDNQHTWHMWQNVVKTYMKYQRIPKTLAKVYWSPVLPRTDY
ncbi:MAG: hypothetical protein R3B13_10525 [Polyangiaceae bacterium]